MEKDDYLKARDIIMQIQELQRQINIWERIDKPHRLFYESSRDHYTPVTDIPEKAFEQFREDILSDLRSQVHILESAFMQI